MCDKLLFYIHKMTGKNVLTADGRTGIIKHFDEVSQCSGEMAWMAYIQFIESSSDNGVCASGEQNASTTTTLRTFEDCVADYFRALKKEFTASNTGKKTAYYKRFPEEIKDMAVELILRIKDKKCIGGGGEAKTKQLASEDRDGDIAIVKLVDKVFAPAVFKSWDHVRAFFQSHGFEFSAATLGRWKLEKEKRIGTRHGASESDSNPDDPTFSSCHDLATLDQILMDTILRAADLGQPMSATEVYELAQEYCTDPAIKSQFFYDSFFERAVQKFPAVSTAIASTPTIKKARQRQNNLSDAAELASSVGVTVGMEMKQNSATVPAEALYEEPDSDPLALVVGADPEIPDTRTVTATPPNTMPQCEVQEPEITSNISKSTISYPEEESSSLGKRRHATYKSDLWTHECLEREHKRVRESIQSKIHARKMALEKLKELEQQHHRDLDSFGILLKKMDVVLTHVQTATVSDE